MKTKNRKRLYMMLALAAAAADIAFVVLWSFPLLIIGNVLALISMIGFGRLGKEASDKTSMLFFALAALCFGGGILVLIVLCLLAIGALWLFSVLVGWFIKLVQGITKMG